MQTKNKYKKFSSLSSSYFILLNLHFVRSILVMARIFSSLIFIALVRFSSIRLLWDSESVVLVCFVFLPAFNAPAPAPTIVDA